MLWWYIIMSLFKIFKYVPCYLEICKPVTWSVTRHLLFEKTMLIKRFKGDNKYGNHLLETICVVDWWTDLRPFTTSVHSPLCCCVHKGRNSQCTLLTYWYLFGRCFFGENNFQKWSTQTTARKHKWQTFLPRWPFSKEDEKVVKSKWN